MIYWVLVLAFKKAKLFWFRYVICFFNVFFYEITVDLYFQYDNVFVGLFVFAL